MAYAALQFIPTLSHEADGLIFQPIDDAYVSGTCEELLKWKFAELNTVDFLFLFNHNNSGSKLAHNLHASHASTVSG